MIEDFTSRLPPHKCGLYLSHNEHKDYHENISDFIEDRHELYNWESEQDKQECIIRNEIWSLQWYPETSVGFYAAAASSLKKLLKLVEGFNG